MAGGITEDENNIIRRWKGQMGGKQTESIIKSGTVKATWVHEGESILEAHSSVIWWQTEERLEGEILKRSLLWISTVGGISKPLGMKQSPKESYNYIADSTYFILREKSQLLTWEQEALPGELVSGFRNSVNSLKSYMGIFYKENDSIAFQRALHTPSHPPPSKKVHLL